MSRNMLYGSICVLLAAVLMISGCMGFGGSTQIIAQRYPGRVKGPKKLQDWDTFKWPAYNGPKKRVAVSVVKDATGHPKGAATAKLVEAELHNILFATNAVVLLEGREDQIKGSLNEMDMAAAGMTYAPSAPEAGKFIGAAFAIDATVTRMQDEAGGGGIGGIGASNDGKFGGFAIGGKRCEATVQVQIRDNQTRQVIATFRGEGYDAKGSFGLTSVTVNNQRMDASAMSTKANTSLGRAVRRAVNEAVLSIVNRLGEEPWKGVVVDVPDDTRIAIKGGKDMNLVNGMRLKVFHKTQELMDPTTGESLGFDTVEVATVVINRVLERASFATLESGSLEDVEINDFLRMIPVAATPAANSDANQL